MQTAATTLWSLWSWVSTAVRRGITAYYCSLLPATRLPCAQFATFSLHSGPPQSAQYTPWCSVLPPVAPCTVAWLIRLCMHCGKLNWCSYSLFKMGSGPLWHFQPLFCKYSVGSSAVFGIFSLDFASTSLEVLPSLTFSASILKVQSWKFCRNGSW